jgi:hypothetical protein
MPVQTPDRAGTGHRLARRRSGGTRASPDPDDLAHRRLPVGDPRVERPHAQVKAPRVDLVELDHDRMEPSPLLVDLDDVARPDPLGAASRRWGGRGLGQQGRLAHRREASERSGRAAIRLAATAELAWPGTRSLRTEAKCGGTAGTVPSLPRGASRGRAARAMRARSHAVRRRLRSSPGASGRACSQRRRTSRRRE